MPMPRMKVTNTHGLGIDEIAKLAAHAEKPYTRQTLTAVVMTLQGIPAETIAQNLCLKKRESVEQARHRGLDRSQRWQPKSIHRGDASGYGRRG